MLHVGASLSASSSCSSGVVPVLALALRVLFAALCSFSLAFSSVFLARSSSFRFRSSSFLRLFSSLSHFLCSLSSSSFFFFCSFSSNISNAAVLVNKRARGIAFFGALGVDADGTTNRFVRESSFSPPLLRSVGVCPERFGEFELEVSGVAVLKLSSTVTGARGCTVENCSASDNYGSDWKTEVYF